MHDPQTAAFEIRTPWFKCRPWPKSAVKDLRRGWNNSEVWGRMSEADKRGRDSFWDRGYRNSLVTIWHVDPEKDGSDDSCGWSFPKLKHEQIERLKAWAWSEGRDPYFLRASGREWVRSRHEAEAMYRALILHVGQIIGRSVTWAYAAEKASKSIHNPDCIDPAAKFCFEPGYHSNSKEDRPQHREEAFLSICCGVARGILRDKRHWWQHPKWHLHHWKLQIHPWQAFRRRLLTRCEVCGKPFVGESPISNCWDRPRVRWFRGEQGLRHSSCDRKPAPVSDAAASAFARNIAGTRPNRCHRIRAKVRWGRSRDSQPCGESGKERTGRRSRACMTGGLRIMLSGNTALENAGQLPLDSTGLKGLGQALATLSRIRNQAVGIHGANLKFVVFSHFSKSATHLLAQVGIATFKFGGDGGIYLPDRLMRVCRKMFDDLGLDNLIEMFTHNLTPLDG